MNKLAFLSDKVNDTRFSTPETVLLDALQEVREGKRKNEKCLVLWLDQGDEKEQSFRVSFVNSGLKTSEIVALCECMKARCFAMMGYVNGPDNDLAA